MTLRTADEARQELQRQGVSISSWALANGFSTTQVFEVLAGRNKATRGKAHNIAVKLGLKEGEVCTDPANALERRAAQAAMPLKLYPTSRHTGWQVVFGLRTDQYGLGYESQSELGCLDATTSMPAGSVVGISDFPISNVRFVCERTFLRAGA